MYHIESTVAEHSTGVQHLRGTECDANEAITKKSTPIVASPPIYRAHIANQRHQHFSSTYSTAHTHGDGSERGTPEDATLAQCPNVVYHRTEDQTGRQTPRTPLPEVIYRKTGQATHILGVAIEAEMGNTLGADHSTTMISHRQDAHHQGGVTPSEWHGRSRGASRKTRNLKECLRHGTRLARPLRWR